MNLTTRNMTGKILVLRFAARGPRVVECNCCFELSPYTPLVQTTEWAEHFLFVAGSLASQDMSLV